MQVELDLNQRAKPGQLLGVAIRLGQASAVGGIIMSDYDKTAIGILLAPAVLSRAMTNPTIVKALTQGLRAGATEKEVVKLMGRLTTQLTREGMPFEITGDEPQPQPELGGL